MLPENFSNAPEYSEPTPVLYLQHNVSFFCSSVHGFVQTTDLVINEGATQEVITMVLDIKGNTITEPASTRVLNFGFSFTCIYNSNGGGPQAVGELWTWTLKQIGCFNHRVVTLVGRLSMYRHGDCER